MKIGNTVSRLLCIVLLVCITESVPAQRREIDSLRNELMKFEIKKRQMGANVSAQTDTVKIRILSKLIEKTFLYDPKEAMANARILLSISQRAKDQFGIANAYNSLGVLHEMKSDYSNALKFYKMSLAIKLRTNDKSGQIDTYTNIGTMHAKTGNTPDALSNMMKALQLSKEINDIYGIAGVSNNLGVIYTYQKDYPNALKNYFSSLAALEQLKDAYMLSVTYQNIGEIYLRQDNPEQAMAYFKKGLRLAIQVGDKTSMANNYSSTGRVYQYLKDYQTAYRNYQTALRLRQEIGDSNGISNSYITIGYVQFKIGDTPSAISNISKGLDAAKKNGEMDIVTDAYKYLSEIYETTGNYKLALKNHVLYKAANDSVFSTEKEKNIAQLKIRYDYKSMQDSIASVQDKKNIIARDKVRRQSTVRNFIFIAFGLVVLFLIILIIQRNKIADIKRQKALEQERNRISRDLHDNLGAQLSTARMFVSSLKNNPGTETETIENTVELLDDSILELRKIMNDTHASVLHDRGLLAATEELANRVNQLHAVTFTLSHHNMDKRPAFDIEHELYRITQELVNNTLKYSGAKNISIELIKRDGSLILMYEDDGKGFDVHTVLKGNGLHNIEYRANEIGGSIELDTKPDAGFRAIVEIPLTT